jgi:ABC-2 type transport system ATP-binding protein
MPDDTAIFDIHVHQLCMRYGTIVALDDVSFTVAPGSITALLGGNGAGKTTALSILLGLLIPTSGSVQVVGVDMLRDRYRALQVMNFQSPYVDLPRRLSVRENLSVYAALYGVADVAGRIRALSGELELDTYLDRPTGDLSAGQRTRVALAKAMINEPRVLLLDEPTASLDPDTADWIRGYLAAYRDRTGATLLLASHNMAEVERLCDQVTVLRAGRVVDSGPPADLIRRYGRRTLEEVFIDIARHGAGSHATQPAAAELKASAR